MPGKIKPHRMIEWSKIQESNTYACVISTFTPSRSQLHSYIINIWPTNIL